MFVVDSVIRQIKVLALIPQLPASTTISEVHNKINEYGFDVTSKTIERDINALCRFFPITTVENSKPYRWSFSEIKMESILNLSLEMALMLSLVKNNFQGLFPSSISEYLSPYFKQADKELSSLSKNSVASWRDKIHIVHDSLAFQNPEVDDDVIDKLYCAVMQEKRIVVNYCARGKSAREYHLNPLGIVLKGSLTYLVCTSGEHESILQFLVSRFNSVTILDAKISDASRGVSVKSYIEQGGFSILRNSENIKFVARIKKVRGWHLFETPLSEDQEIIEDQEDSFILKATVADSLHLLWWVLSLGSRIEVIEPESLRNEVISQMKEMVAQYS